MARVKLELPAQFNFRTNIPIRIQDLNYGNHVGNDAILSIMHEARLRTKGLRRVRHVARGRELPHAVCAQLRVEWRSVRKEVPAIVERGRLVFRELVVCHGSNGAGPC